MEAGGGRGEPVKRGAPMKRTAGLKQGKPMKRGGPMRSTPAQTVRPQRARAPLVLSAPGTKPTAVLRQVSGEVRAAPKDNPLQHGAYMAIVRTLPCIRCGIEGYTQFAHADWSGRGGKGKGIKSDCRLGYPACGPHDNTMGCHYLIGSTGTLARAVRHALEAEYGRRTRFQIIGLGLWPASLPLWVEEPANAATFNHQEHA